MKEIFQSFLKQYAKVYSAIPENLRIALYVGSSYIAAKFLTYLGEDITALETDNRYLLLLVEAVTVLIAGLINILQVYTKGKGVELLAASGDSKTLNQLKTKIEETKEIRDKASK